jgi:hypothetical protein
MHALADVETRAMTEDEVLAVLRDWHRHASGDEVDTSAAIEYDTTVQEYWFGPMVFDRVLGSFNPGQVLNEHFRVNLPLDQWANVVNPCRERTLRDVCRFLAGRARVARMKPATFFDQPCLTAGVFLTIRTLLARAGVDVANLRPSSPLGPYLIDWYVVFLRDVAKMAPGTLPMLRIINPLHDACIFTVMLAWLVGFFTCLLAGGPIGPLWQSLFGVCSGLCLVVGIVAYIGSWIAVRVPPTRVEFGSLHDFRDLVRALIGSIDAEPVR